jgi:hypothetical protein
MPAAETIIAVANVVLVCVTAALVLVTGWLVWEQRASRREESAVRRRAALRAALVEAVENARRAVAQRPDWQQPEGITGKTPKFDALTALLGSVDLPPALVAYLVWARWYSGILSVRYDDCVVAHSDLSTVNFCRPMWEAHVERLQVIACLLREHATKHRELAPVAKSFDTVAWLTPSVWPAQEAGNRPRYLAYENLRATMDAPAWPDGYDGCSPDARDRDSRKA